MTAVFRCLQGKTRGHRPRLQLTLQWQSIMKKSLLLSVFGLILITGRVGFLGSDALPSDQNSEFFFTRLAYSENGSRGWGRFVPKNFRCPEFGGGNFFPQQGLGWSMDSPGADCKYMGGIQRLTNLRVYPNPNMIRITD